MPYINVKVTKPTSRKQEMALKERLGRAIELVPGKSEKALMISISSGEHIFKGGELLEYGAYVNVALKSGATREHCEVLNDAIYNILEQELKIPKKNTYVSFAQYDYFGADGILL